MIYPLVHVGSSMMLYSYLLPLLETSMAALNDLPSPKVCWVLDLHPELGLPQFEVHTPEGDSLKEFDRLRLHFEGSIVGIRNIMLQVSLVLFQHP